jgi:hypothetical protein
MVDLATAGRVDLDGLLPYPEALRIRVTAGCRSRYGEPRILAISAP